jgi:hypothetical protein
MYMNTNYPHSDAELREYENVPFRRFIARRGIIEGVLCLQTAPGDYLLTIGLLPNTPTHHQFYELHYLRYPVTIRAGSHPVPSMFYPNVKVTRRFLAQLEQLELDKSVNG